jgi:hypothetical protein
MRSALLCSFLLIACSGVEDKPVPAQLDGSGTGPAGSTPGEVLGVDGAVSWSVSFDDGRASCDYTRSYSGIEDRSQPWLCPECEVVYKVDVSMSNQDCYDQIGGGSAPNPTEWLGYGGGVWYRGGAENYLLSEQGTVGVQDGVLTPENTTDWTELDGGGSFKLEVTGALTESVATGDPMHGFTAPASYACGWPKADPAPYTGDHRLLVGATVPDGFFNDTCGEPVRLHDFAGDYLVIDISAVDCPPCQDMAAQEPAFVATMDAAGLPTHVITLLAPSLSDVLSTSSSSVLSDWENTFDLHAPVLADRGWGYWVAGDALGEAFAYPTWIVVGPDLTVLQMGTGFGGWDGIQSIIESDAG